MAPRFYRLIMSLSAAIRSGFRPFGRVHKLRVRVVNRHGVLDEVQMTSDEWSEHIVRSVEARCWAADQCDGRSIDGPALRPILATHVVERGNLWRLR